MNLSTNQVCSFSFGIDRVTLSGGRQIKKKQFYFLFLFLFLMIMFSRIMNSISSLIFMLIRQWWTVSCTVTSTKIKHDSKIIIYFLDCSHEMHLIFQWIIQLIIAMHWKLGQDEGSRSFLVETKPSWFCFQNIGWLSTREYTLLYSRSLVFLLSNADKFTADSVQWTTLWVDINRWSYCISTMIKRILIRFVDCSQRGVVSTRFLVDRTTLFMIYWTREKSRSFPFFRSTTWSKFGSNLPRLL